MPTAVKRDYAPLLAAMRSAFGPTPAAPRSDAERLARMQTFVDLAWDALAPTGVSWLGFYTINPEGDAMVLAARRDKPACSPIGLHGACGQCFVSRKPLIVRDVKDLGANYVACDPRDASEVVVPCFGPDGGTWGVLDLDSWDVGSFTDADATALTSLLQAAGLTSSTSP